MQRVEVIERKTSCRGATIIELMLVLALGVLVLAVPASSMIRRLGSLSVAQHALRLQSAIGTCRAIASARGAAVAVELAAGERSVSLIEVEGSSSENGRKILFTLPPGIAITEAQFAASGRPGQLVLYPSGTVSPGHFVLAAGNRRCTITLSLRGAVRTRCIE